MELSMTHDDEPFDPNDVNSNEQIEAERWQLHEIQAGLKELDEGRGVAHKQVAAWLRSWGRKHERKAPRPRA
jgi:predicted transcriptional regulator